MTQPPYRPSEGHPMRRFAIFAAVLVVIVGIGSQPWPISSGSMKSMCVCVPARAALILKSMTGKSAVARAQTQVKRQLTVTASLAQ
jgi:hypothetical protein